MCWDRLIELESSEQQQSINRQMSLAQVPELAKIENIEAPELVELAA